MLPIRCTRTLTLTLTIALSACANRPQDLLTPPGDRVTMPSAPPLDAEATQLGVSHQGRPLFVRHHGAGQKRLLIIGLIHGDETEVYQRFDQLWLRLTTAGYEQKIQLAGIATMNPDGYERATRGNAQGVDLNRNWPAPNFRPSGRHGPTPLSEPEVDAVHRYIQQANPHAIIVFHSTPDGPFVDPDGPALADTLAQAFVRAVKPIDPSWRVNADFTNPAGSLGTWFGLDQQRPILTVEFRPGSDPDRALSTATAGTLAVMRELLRNEPPPPTIPPISLPEQRPG